ncbi:MAG: hypothetical protein WEB87_03005 [Bacteriovoracaceae bacterium]
MNRFCGKVLLFGEYSVIKGGKGLALPFFDYSGALEKLDSSLKGDCAASRLAEFAQFLRNSSILRRTLDLDKLEEDISKGLSFESDIPEGSGVGSSGALCAAIYSDYHLKKSLKDIQDSSNMAEILDHMALMESFYHGSSSGLDPLISLAQKPALVKSRNKIEFVSFDFDSEPELELYLFNTKTSRRTSPLVHDFLKMCEEPSFELEAQEFMRVSDELILATLTNDAKAFDELFYFLSKWQFLNLRPMVCPSVHALWLEGLESKKFYLKLCGAGGGGHYIIYNRSPEKAFEQELKGRGAKKIKF